VFFRRAERKMERTLRQMRDDWDRRARENARHFVASAKSEWTDAEFFASGELAVSDFILEDLAFVCQGKDPKSMRVLEIGCGAARVTRALARMFGEVHAVDVSGEMVRIARASLLEFPNAHVYQNNGMDLSVLPPLSFDFAFSMIVFQHIPSHAIIENYIREVHRVLTPGALFKFEVQGKPVKEINTWVGVTITPERAQQMADATGFELRQQDGIDTQDYWLWFVKRQPGAATQS